MELLTVMVIMVLMMSIAGVSFFTARQGAEMRGAVRAVQTTISLARQQAVVKRTRYNLTFVGSTNMNGVQSGCMILEAVRSVTNSAHEIRYLPPLVTFSKVPSPNPLVFETDGSAGGVADVKDIELSQSGGTPTTLHFNSLIGAMQE